MKSHQLLRLLAVPFGIAPFAFSAMRYMHTGNDLRMLWMSLASLLGAVVVFLWRQSHESSKAAILRSAGLAWILGTVFAAICAVVLGTKSGVGVWMVALVLAAFWSISYALHALSRQRSA